MIKTVMAQKEPVIYRVLKRAFAQKKVAQAFLLAGEVNPLKYDCAILLAQSILEDQADLACEECERCQRIAQLKHLDVTYINGHEKMIVKDNLEAIFTAFHRTALEKDNKKVFIIDGFENASLKVSNMILKSLEEPNSHSFWILITDKEDELLPTIKSRCEILRFHKIDRDELKKAYQAEGFTEEDAKLLAHITDQKIAIAMDDPLYLSAKELMVQTIAILNEPYLIETLYIEKLYNAFKRKDNADLSKCEDYYLRMMIAILKGGILSRGQFTYLPEDLDEAYNAELLKLFYQIRQSSFANIDRKLLFDRLAWGIVSYKKGV